MLLLLFLVEIVLFCVFVLVGVVFMYSQVCVPPMNRRKWLCGICGAVYGSDDGYKRHHKGVHEVRYFAHVLLYIYNLQGEAKKFERVIAMEVADRAAAIRKSLTAPPPVCLLCVKLLTLPLSSFTKCER